MRIFGLHSVRVQDTVTIYVIVLGNLFNTDKKMHEKYDLKVDGFNVLLISKGIMDCSFCKRTCG